MSFLRSLFGPSKDEVWRQFAEAIHADFVEGGFWKDSKVEATVGEWTVTLDTHRVSTGKSSVTYTRMRAPYVNRDGFRFKLYREGFFSPVGRFMGMQDIEIGHPPFDEAFVIQANNETTIRRLLANARIRALFEAQPEISLEVKDDEGWFGSHFPEGVDELHFQVVGTIKDVEWLKALYGLFAEILQELCRIGSAYADDPGVTLK
jgi:hypothetical protein